MRREGELHAALLAGRTAEPSSAASAAIGPGPTDASLATLATSTARELWARDPEATPFQHPDWLRAWWAVFAPDGGPESWVWEAHGADGRPTVLAAWAVHRRPFRIGADWRRLQLVGQSTWCADAFPTEYADLVIAAPTPADRARRYAQALDATLHHDWDDLRIDHLVENGAFARALAAWAQDRGYACRAFPGAPAWVVDTRGSAERYWAARSANARRALRGKRRAARDLRYVHAAAAVDGGPEPLATLFGLHAARWGEDGMPPRARRFLEALARTAAPELALRTSLLVDDATPVSASLNVDCRGVVYNLQGGFAPDHHRRLSLGKLHAGYEIDAAFARGARAFDLLVGRGMKDDYKAGIATRAVPTVALWVARSRRARWLLAARRWRGAGD